MSSFQIFDDDLPSSYVMHGDIAIDTEAMGLKIGRDRLCLVQICDANQKCCAVHFHSGDYSAPNLKRLLSNPAITKIIHFARFDMRIIQEYLDVELKNVFCTHIGSRIARTYTNNHSLKELCRDLLGLQMNKIAGCSDWGGKSLSKDQKDYAMRDVRHLHELRDALTEMLVREGRLDLVKRVFSALSVRIELDLCGWDDVDVFAHHVDTNK